MSAVASVTGFLKKHVLGQTLIRRNPFYYDAACEAHEEVDALGLAGRRAWAERQLVRTFELARGTEYGRSVKGGLTLSSWPLLEKEPLRHGLQAFTSGAEWLAARATTGGTSGVPLKVLRSLQAIVFEQASIDRLIQKAGADPRTARTAVLRGDNPRDLEISPNPDVEYINNGRMLTMSANAVTHTSAEFVADKLEKFSPELLCAYPTALETLCRYLRDSNRRLAIPAVVTSSEVFRPDAWQLTEAMLGARVIDYYGQAERIAFAQAEAPREYRFACAYAYVEFIPYDGSALPRGSPFRLYEIVGTSYWNNVLPIVRYRTGDLVKLPAHWGAAELEELSLGLRTFEGVLGRQQEIIVCPHSVRLSGIGCLPHDVRNVVRMQVVQETFDEVRIFVLPADGFCSQDAEDLLANARARVPPEVNVTVEIASRLERTPRGKTPLIVHRPPVHDALRRQGVEPLFTR
jgi:phenylacetate-coenzyme A ligase PaaK-like adenylate-forming protein